MPHRKAHNQRDHRVPSDRHLPGGQAARVPAVELKRLLADAGIAASEEALRVMRVHFELLMCWNAKINLTSIRSPEEVLRRHFVESAYLVRRLPLGSGVLYDIGSGAGFPGLPVKALVPEINLVLVESNLKKAVFLKEVIREAGLPGARVESDRVENLLHRAEIELGDWITMRAVGGFQDLLRVFRHLLLPHGRVALFLGDQDASKAAAEPGWEWEDPFALPGSERRVILVGQNLSGT